MINVNRGYCLLIITNRPDIFNIIVMSAHLIRGDDAFANASNTSARRNDQHGYVRKKIMNLFRKGHTIKSHVNSKHTNVQ